MIKLAFNTYHTYMANATIKTHRTVLQQLLAKVATHVNARSC